MIEGQQLSLFDYDIQQEKPKSEYPPIIEELDRELTLLFVGTEIRDKKYEVWSHVPNLGKRYKMWVDVRNKKDVMNIDFGRIVEKYKAKELEVSISSTGCLKDGYSHSLMISTMWMTKNHKEKTDAN